jgi:hypothetical protein
MNAVVELEVVEPKSLTELLVIKDECPLDFYKNPAYLQQVKDVNALAKSLVHTIDDAGRTASKKDTAAIRKYSKATNGFALNVFRSLTEKMTAWRGDFTKEIKELDATADAIDAKFKKMEQEKLDLIKGLLEGNLELLRKSSGVNSEFRTVADLSSLVKLSGTLTEKGVLTAKAVAFVKAIADAELAQQNKIEARHLLLENRCLRAEINPPLTKIHFGTVFYADDEFFNEKMEELITLEVERKAEMVAKIERDNKAANEKKIADALVAQQEEANRKAKENAVVEAKPEPIAAAKTPTQLREIANSIAASAERAPTNEARNNELAGANKLRRQADDLEREQSQETVTINTPEPRVEERRVAPAAGTRTVYVTATFTFEGVGENTSNMGVANFFLRQLPEKLAAIAGDVSSR